MWDKGAPSMEGLECLILHILSFSKFELVMRSLPFLSRVGGNLVALPLYPPFRASIPLSLHHTTHRLSPS